MVSTNLTHKCVATGSKLTEGFPVVYVFNTIQINFIGERFLKITVTSKFVAMVLLIKTIKCKSFLKAQ